MNGARVLIVDDENSLRATVAAFLRHQDFAVETMPHDGKVLEFARTADLDAAVVDLSASNSTGEQTVGRLKQVSPDTEVIVLTSLNGNDSDVGPLQEHVFDYLSKPFALETLAQTLRRAVERRRLVLENRELLGRLRRTQRTAGRTDGAGVQRDLERCRAASSSLIGESQSIRRIRQLVAEVASDEITVLIRGESGTGKNVVARLIHDSSSRQKTGEFVKINCPAIPETLLESELFGHECGAFTGAASRKPGRLELGANGTVLLDEIGEIPLSLQAKLLQAIEHKQFTRLGGNDTIRIDARIMAATNAPLESMIAEGRFRQDLFYRLNQYSIFLPPLRERVEDIPPLVEHFLDVHTTKHGRNRPAISPEGMSLLVRHPWPGNVRELESVIKRFILTEREDSIFSALGQQPDPVRAAAGTDALRRVEIQTIIAALVECRWNQRRAAQILGISYSSLRRRIMKYDLKNRCSAPVRIHEGRVFANVF